MSLDQELNNGSYDQETNTLRDALIDLHKKLPEQCEPENRSFSGDFADSDRSCDRDSVKENSGTESVTETKEELYEDTGEAGVPQKKDNKPKRVKIAPAFEDCCKPFHNNNKQLHAFETNENGNASSSSHLSQNSAISDKQSNLGQIYHQQKDGSKTLEIYNNIVLPEESLAKSVNSLARADL